MSKEIMSVDIDTLLTEITYQTVNIFKETATQEQITLFREYLEDTILFDIISCKSHRIVCASAGQNVTDNIKLALIASGISKTGTIPEGKKYDTLSHYVTQEDHYYAKKRVREIDFENQNGSYISKMNGSINSFRANKNVFPNVVELVEMGIAQNERNCGYIEEHSQAIDVFEGATHAIWMTKREMLEEYGLQNNLAYEICELIYSRPQAKHYPLATKIALRNMAEICLYVAQYGKHSFTDDEKLEETLRNIEAAKLTDEEIIRKFEKRFKRIMLPEQLTESTEKKDNRKGLFLLPKKNR